MLHPVRVQTLPCPVRDRQRRLMHYSVYVALPGQLPDDESVLQYELERALDPFNPEGKSPEWDWWLIGGRWGGAWVLREGAANGPLATEPGVFGATEHDDGR